MTTQADTTLRLTRTFKAPRERVFAAWTKPEELKRWYAPVGGWTVSVADVDLRVGGGYHVVFGPDGNGIDERGTYIEVDPPARLVYEMVLEGEQARERTRTIVEFAEIDGATQVTLTEEGYTTAETRDMHARGWTHMLESLGTVLDG